MRWVHEIAGEGFARRSPLCTATEFRRVTQEGKQIACHAFDQLDLSFGEFGPPCLRARLFRGLSDQLMYRDRVRRGVNPAPSTMSFAKAIPSVSQSSSIVARGFVTRSSYRIRTTGPMLLRSTARPYAMF